MKIYLSLVSIIIVIIILAFNFLVFPELEKTLTELIPAQAEIIKDRLLNITIILLASVFLINYYSWKLINNLTKERSRIEQALLGNPEDQTLQNRMAEIDKRKKLYFAFIGPAFMIILGLIIGLMATTIMQPLYSLLNTL